LARAIDQNPATKGTVLYNVFEVQAYLGVAVGALLAYNVIFPSEISATGVVDPTIARLMGMWSIWYPLSFTHCLL
jgi:hypothetical protein